MFLQRNVASQVFTLPSTLRAIADGSAVTSGAAITWIKDGTSGVSAGTLTHITDGGYTYQPTQGETDCKIAGWVLTKTGSVGLAGSIRTTNADPNDGTRLALTALPAFAPNANGGLPILSSSGTTLAYTISTLTTYTGNTVQTGDAYAYLGTNLGALGANATALASATNLAEANADLDELIVSIYLIPTNPYTGTPPTAAAIRTEIDSNSTQLAAIKLVTDHLATALELHSAAYRFTVAALANAPSGGGGGGSLTTPLTEDYAAVGDEASAAQLLYSMYGIMTNAAVSGTTMTAKKLDGSTAAMTLTLDSASTPTAIHRAT